MTDLDRWMSWVHRFFAVSPVKGRWLPSRWEQAFVGRCDGVTLAFLPGMGQVPFRWLEDCRTDVCPSPRNENVAELRCATNVGAARCVMA